MTPDGLTRYGSFLETLRTAVTPGGSELELGVTLFALAVSIRAAQCIEIGRYKGFSALALAGAMRLLDEEDWRNPGGNGQGFQSRPDVDYGHHEGYRDRRVYSVDPVPDPDAPALWKRADLDRYITMLDKRSVDVHIEQEISPDCDVDLIFIDGDHGHDAAMADVNMYVPRIRKGGYFVLHDVFGWFDHNGLNGSPIKQVCDNLMQTRFKEHLLIDTGYPSFMIFRKAA